MKKLVMIGLVVASISCKETKNISPLQQFEGSWKTPIKDGFIGETWVAKNDSYLTSKAYFIKEKDTTIYETVLLEQKAGETYYTVTSTSENDKQPIAFKLTSATKSKFVFENPQHDFPKRIVYEFIGADSLHAFIDEGSDTATKRNHFYYSKVKP